MEDNKTIIDKIKGMLFAEDETSEVEVKLEDVKAADGSIIRVVESLEVGAEAAMIQEDGSLVLLIDMEIELEDGRVIRTDSEGLITEILDAPEESDDDMGGHEDDEKKKLESSEEVTESKETEEVKAEEVKEIKEEKTELELLEEKFEAKFSELETKFKKLSGEPAEEEIKVEKSTFTNEEKFKKDALDAIVQFRQKK